MEKPIDPRSDPDFPQDESTDLSSVFDPGSVLVDPQVSIQDVLQIMAGRAQDQATLFFLQGIDAKPLPQRHSYVVIGSEQQVWGLVTASDLIDWIAAQPALDSQGVQPIRQVLPQDPPIVRATQCDGGGSLLSFMQQRQLRWLPMVDDRDRLLGVIAWEKLLLHQAAQASVVSQSSHPTDLEQSMQLRVQREQTFSHVTQVIRSSLNLEEIFTVSVTEIARFLNAEASIVQYLPEQQCWRHVVISVQGQAKPEKLNLDIPAAGNPFSDQLIQLQTVRVEHTEQIQDPINQDLARSFPGTWLLNPISVRGVLWGSLSLHRSDPGNTWQDEELDLARRVTDQLGIGIQQAQMYQRLQQELGERKQVEADLRASREFFSLAAAAVDGMIYDTNVETWITKRLGVFDTLGYSSEDIDDHCSWWATLIHPEDKDQVLQAIQRDLAQENALFRSLEYRVRHKQGHYIHLLDYAVIVRNQQGQATRIVGHSLDITERKQLELKLKQQLDQSRLINRITQQLRRSLHLDRILSTAVEQVRDLLQVDRVVIYRFLPDYSGEVIAESVEAGCLSLMSRVIVDPCFKGDLIRNYQRGRITMIEDVEQDELQICHRELLQDLQVRANLVVPILVEQSLWGLLIAHQCSGPHAWSPWATEIMEQLASQLGIAIQQSLLYGQLQSSNQELSYQVNVRNSQLHKALELEALLRLIIEEVRESLEEKQILETTVRELTHGLNLMGCRVNFPDASGRTFRAIQCYPMDPPICPESEECLEPELLSQLKQAARPSILRTQIDPRHSPKTILSCGIREGEELIAILDLIHPAQKGFTEPEIRLAEQVASQCAIGIRQARLYQASQAQIQQLTELNQLKEEFVHMVSHELRTPLTNMKMSLTLLKTFDLPERGSRYLEILRGECEREITLVNELLDLQAIESGRRALMITPLEIHTWIHALVESFSDRMQERHQQLQLGSLDSPDRIPILHTDRDLLERVVVELLNNACKYTPPHHQIRIRLQPIPINDRQGIRIEVENTGVEISVEGLPHLFDKFYRVPQVDQWKQGGTGLGLALVKKAISYLGGRIWVRSGNQSTCFLMEIPDLMENDPCESP